MTTRTTFHVAFLLIALHTVHMARAQYGTLDRGNGKLEDLRTGFTAFDLITDNATKPLFALFAYKAPIDTAEIKRGCAYAHDHFPNKHDGSGPPCFYSDTPNELWYERTYYREENGRVEYLFQMRVDLTKGDSSVYVRSLTFRTGKDIQPHDDLLKKIFERPEDEPPPPPPPFGLPPR